MTSAPFFELLAILFTTANVGLLTAIFFKLGRIEGLMQGTTQRLEKLENATPRPEFSTGKAAR